MINIFSSSRYSINRPLIKDVVYAYLKNKSLQDYTINIVFIGRIKMKQLANKYKNEDVALPILTFKYNEKINEDNLLGEIFICYPQMVLLAAEKNKTIKETLTKLLIHGLENLLK